MKISVLIPAFNRPQYLVRALESVLKQSVTPYEIIIADDLTEDRERNYKILLPYLEKYSFIKYVQNCTNLGGVQNYANLVHLASGDYIKFLAEDDLLYPKNLEILSSFLERYEDVKIATSIRDVLNERSGKKIELSSTKPLFSKTCIVDGKKVIIRSLNDMKNYIGEFSTYMFRKSDISKSFFKECGEEFDTNADWLLWMRLASQGKVAYVVEPLSCFRYGVSNDQLKTKHVLRGFQENLLFLTTKCLQTLGLSSEDVELFHSLELLGRWLVQLSKILNKNDYVILKMFLMQHIQMHIDRCKKKVEKCKATVSVIIVTYNSQKTIAQCLESLLIDLDDNDEIIIVDNASQDDTLKTIRRIGDDRVKIIENKTNLGYSAGVNKGICKASKDYLIFLNPDTVVTQGFKRKLLDPLEKELFAVVSPLTTYVAGAQKIEQYTCFYTIAGKENINLVSDYLDCLYRKDPFFENKLLIGYCIALSKKTIETVGGLDEDLFLGNDDLEFSWRLQKFRLKQAILKNCFIYHEGHHSFKQSGSEAEQLVQESTRELAKKLIAHYGYGNVPLPEEIWNMNWFRPIGKEFEFMFRFSNKRMNFALAESVVEGQQSRIGVILANYRNWEDTNACVQSLQESEYRNLQILVVDNSGVSISELEKKYNTDAVFLSSDKNIPQESSRVWVLQIPNHGFAHAVNRGIEILQDRCDYIWILNNDTVVPPSTMAKLLETSLKTGRDVVTCKIKDFADREKIQYDGSKASLSPFEDYEDIVKNATFLSGANIFIKSKLFNKLGYFDEQYFLYFEDTDFYYRLLKHGIIPLYTPFAYIYHKGGATIGGWKNSPISMYYATRNKFLFNKRYGVVSIEQDYQMILFDFTQYLSQKNVLRAMYTGIVDAFSGVTGKREELEFFINYKKSMENRLKLKIGLTNDTLLHLYTTCMNRPRDKNALKGLLKYFFSKKEKIYENICSIDSKK